MSFGHSVSICLRRWTTFSGRASRAEYWSFMLCLALAATLGLFAAGAILGAAGARASLVLALPVVLGAVYLCVASLAATVRRLHDRNVSGWWVAVVAALGFLDLAINTGGTAGGFGLVLRLGSAGVGVALLAQALLRGGDGANGYGPDPLGQAATPAVGAGRHGSGPAARGA